MHLSNVPEVIVNAIYPVVDPPELEIEVAIELFRDLVISLGVNIEIRLSSRVIIPPVRKVIICGMARPDDLAEMIAFIMIGGATDV
jgi:hypothetical protein